MSDWKVIVKEATKNHIENPSFEIAGNFAADPTGGVATRVATYQFKGIWSCRVQTSADNEGVYMDTEAALANAIHYATVRVRGTLPTAWDWSVDNATYTAPSLIKAYGDGWSLYGLQLPAAQCNGATAFYINQNGAGSGDFYIDAVQIEQKEYWTTYCDGDQPGCWWDADEHASSSQRTAQSTAGGREYDFDDDYGFKPGVHQGTGAGDISHYLDSFAILPGGIVQGKKERARSFVIVGTIVGTSASDLMDKRQSLLTALSPEVPETEVGPQPIKLRFMGATITKEIECFYDGGLEANITAAFEKYEMRVALRFLAADPHWYGLADTAIALDTNDTATLRHCAGRLRSTGQWDDLGLTSNPTAGTIRNAYVANDGSVYVGGDFTDLDGVANRDYIAKYDPLNDAWSTVGAGSSVNGQIDAIIENAAGEIYIGGYFTNVGDVDGDYVAYWDGAAWNSVSSGGVANVHDIAFGTDGTLYICGSFLNWNAIANADRIVSWDGSAYAALSTGADARCDALAVAPDGTLYVGGRFATIGGVAIDNIASWDGSSFSALGDGLNSDVYALLVLDNGHIVAGGNFTGDGTSTFNYIAEWNGTSWSALGTGMNALVRDLALTKDGTIYASGNFTSAGGITIANRVARWNGSSWTHIDVELPGTPNVWMASGRSDPVIEKNADIFLAFDTTGSGYFSGTASPSNSGNARTFPRIEIDRSGGTSAKLHMIRNETTGDTLYCDYAFLDGEKLTIDLASNQKTVMSDIFGARPDAALPGSDLGQFALVPGSNQITAFVDTAGAPTMTAYIVWRTPYKSFD
jgi:hypothetical protein